MTLLHVSDLSTAYQDELILKEINLTIPRGKITALIGPNGCGKSTVLKTMARILKPNQGSLELNGVDIFSQPSKIIAQQLALLPQSPITPDGIIVRDLVAYGRSPHLNHFGQLSNYDNTVVAEAMAIAGVTEFADRHVDQLSGGQRQRVWIAMALAQKTETLLLDEPTTYLDLAHQFELLNSLRQLNRDGKSIIIVLHDLNQACRYADFLVVIQQGEVAVTGTPREVFTEPMLKQVFDLNAKIFDDPITSTPMCVAR